jgi:hypothetical protein
MIPLVPHHSLLELEQLEQQSTNLWEKTQWHVIWLLHLGKRTRRNICRTVGISGRGLMLLLERYNRFGTVQMDLRRNNARPTKLEPVLKSKLWAWLNAMPNASAQAVQEWLLEHGLKVHLSTAWRYRSEFAAKLPLESRAVSASQPLDEPLATTKTADN